MGKYYLNIIAKKRVSLQPITKPTERLFFDMRREIDPQSSPRGRAFDLWKDAPMPKVTITKTFNIGRLVTADQRRGLKTNMLMCWCIGHAASPIAEFYTLPAGGRLWQYDRLAVNSVVMTSKGEAHLCDIPFSEDIRQFNEDYIRLTQQVHDTNEDYLLGEQYMAIDTSALSLCEIDSVVSVYSEMFTDPFLAWGGDSSRPRCPSPSSSTMPRWTASKPPASSTASKRESTHL